MSHTKRLNVERRRKSRQNEANYKGQEFITQQLSGYITQQLTDIRDLQPINLQTSGIYNSATYRHHGFINQQLTDIKG